MPEDARLLRRAAWVGLRTLRQRPKVVGQTESGEAVFEVGSTRLVLHEEASHFSVLAHCSRCHRQVPGPPVGTPADLDRPSQPVICKNCVQALSSPWRPQMRQVEPDARSHPVPHVGQRARPVDDVRLAAMEAQLEASLARLAELGDAHGADAAREGPASAELATLADAVQDLARWREQVQGTLDGLVGRVRDAEARMDALEGPGEGRFDRGAPQMAPVGSTPGELLDRLQRQLQEAEGRLSRLTAPTGDGA